MDAPTMWYPAEPEADRVARVAHIEHRLTSLTAEYGAPELLAPADDPELDPDVRNDPVPTEPPLEPADPDTED